MVPETRLVPDLPVRRGEREVLLGELDHLGREGRIVDLSG